MATQTLANPAFGASAAASTAHRELDFTFDDEATPAAAPRRLRVPKQEIGDMTAQLAIMTQSGLDLSSALSSLAAQCERPALAAVLRDINDLVHGGNTLSES